MRIVGLALLITGCAYISDKHEDWRLDPDDDGSLYSDDCDDDDESVLGPIAWYRDDDGDGFGVEADVRRRCEQPAGFVAEAGDCDDTDPRVYPSAEEDCDALDNDCNGVVDDDLPQTPWYRDSDGDGFGDGAHEVSACAQPDGHVDNADDCDDTDAAFQDGGSAEVPYNGIDDNCDDSDGDGDWDGDGYWATDYIDLVAENDVEPMEIPAGFGGDCDDTNDTIWPGAMDIAYDGVDADCRGDDDCDLDEDGYGAAEGLCDPEEADCNDADPTVHPGATETCATSYDDNCDGLIDGADLEDCILFYKDFDGDTYGVEDESMCRCGPEIPFTTNVAGDCDDTDTSIWPGAEDALYDGVDADCAGDDDCDGDGDGYGAAVGVCTTATPDCDDTDPDVHPDATEDCSTPHDDDCDGDLDAIDALSCTEMFFDIDGDGFGDDDVSSCSCEPWSLYIETGGDCEDDDAAVFPGAAESCDFVDSDCDDSLLDGFADEDTDGIPDCVHEDADGDGVTIAEGDCDDDAAGIYPGGFEWCVTSFDDDCDGDDNDRDAMGCTVFYADRDADGFGDPGDSRCYCDAKGVYNELNSTDCDDSAIGTYPGAAEAESFVACMRDEDFDGYGAESPPSGVTAGTDCDDGEIGVSPGAAETCDTPYDDDCDSNDNDIDAVGCTVFYLDADGDGHGDPASGLCVCEPLGSFSDPAGDDCEDDDPDIYPDAPEDCDFTDSDCDGSLTDDLFTDTDADGLPDCVDDPDDPIAYSASWRWDGLPGTYTGWSVAVVDDALLVGAMSDDAEALLSRVYFLDWIHPGVTVLEDESISILSSGSAQQVGSSVLGVVDSSDTTRFVVGIRGTSAVAVMTPPTVDLSLSVGTSGDPAVIAGEDPGYCGHAMAAGNLLGTGAPAVMIGCPDSGLGTKVIALDALVGAGSGDALNDLGFQIALGLSGFPGSKEAGYAVAAGDLDGDGIDDAVVGARKSDWPAEHGGSVHVFLGPIDGDEFVSSDDYRIQGGGEVDFMGGEVQVGPDLTGDGRADLIAMAGVGHASWGSDSGSVHLFDYDSLESAPVLDPDDGFASILAAADDPSWEYAKIRVLDDVDGDDQHDLVIGVPLDTLGGLDSGALYFVPGSFSGVISIWDVATVIEGEEGHQLGRSLALGDLDGDGVDEVLVGAPGANQVYGFMATTLAE